MLKIIMTVLALSAFSANVNAQEQAIAADDKHDGPVTVTLRLTQEQAETLPQILDIAIRQMGLNHTTVMALQIAQSLSLAQQKQNAPQSLK